MREEKIFCCILVVFVLKQPYQFIIYTFFRMALETCVGLPFIFFFQNQKNQTNKGEKDIS